MTDSAAGGRAPERRRWRWIAAVGMAMALAGTALARWKDGRRAAARPDIVLVVWDTCRADRVQATGGALPTTPRLSAFAADAVTFRNCYAPSPWTMPSHASIFTGLLPRNHGLREQVGAQVRPGIPTLARTLRDAGYDCRAVVANAFLSANASLRDGFDPCVPVLDPHYAKGRAAAVETAVKETLAARRAAGGRRRPLFLFVNLMDCHLAFTFEDEAYAAVHGRDGLAEARLAADGVTMQDALRHVFGIRRVGDDVLAVLSRAYDGAVRTADRATGAILDAVAAGGDLDRTVFVVTGDHGENLGEGGHLEHLMSVSEEVLRVPLVVRWPGRLTGGRVETAQVRLQDLYPTLLEAAGVAAPPPCGRDATSLAASPLEPRLAVAEFGPASAFRPGFQRENPAAPREAFALLDHSFLAVIEPGPAGAVKYVAKTFHPEAGDPFLQREELFDLAADPGATKDLLRGGDAAARARAKRLAERGRQGR